MVLIYYQPGKTGKTPDELWKGYAPNIAYLKVWGCLAKFLLHELKKRKLGPKTFNAMLVSSGAPLNLWEEAILSACHIQNRIPYKKNGKTPYELWKGYAPNIAYLKVWGCLAKVL